MCMESFPKSNNTESVEQMSDWRELKEKASLQAEALLAGVDHFYEMSFEEKRAALDMLLDQLASDNKNRFIAREISMVRARVDEMARHTTHMTRLGVAA